MKRFLIILFIVNTGFFLQAQEGEKNIKTGNDLYKQKQYEKAIKEYEKIQEWDSSFAIAQFNLGNALYRSGKKDEANKTISALLKNEKDVVQSSKLYYNKGVVLGSQKKLEESIEEYKNALRKNPDDKEARENLQKALLELKKKNPPPKKEDKKKQPQSKMNQKEALQRLKELEQKEKKVQQKMQNQKTTSGSQQKDW